MQIKVKTPVRESRSKVWSAFNRELFLALAPPYPKVGCSFCAAFINNFGIPAQLRKTGFQQQMHLIVNATAIKS